MKTTLASNVFLCFFVVFEVLWSEHRRKFGIGNHILRIVYI